MAKITPGSIVCYNQYERYEPRKFERVYNVKNLSRGKYLGHLSLKNEKRICELVINYNAANNKKQIQKIITTGKKSKPLTFITLTLSALQHHGDKEIKREMLDRFIIAMQRNGKMRSYIWKAEAQQNGNIHFHIVTHSYIQKEFISNTWNKIQLDKGYLNTYRWLHGHCNAPSTKIEACRDIRATAYYVAKYMCKKGNDRAISGRVWGCSDNLRMLRTPKLICDYNLDMALRNAVEAGRIYFKQLEHCVVYTGDIYKFLTDLSPRNAAFYVKEVEKNWRYVHSIVLKNYEKPNNVTTFVETKGGKQLSMPLKNTVKL